MHGQLVAEVDLNSLNMALKPNCLIIILSKHRQRGLMFLETFDLPDMVNKCNEQTSQIEGEKDEEAEKNCFHKNGF